MATEKKPEFVTVRILASEFDYESLTGYELEVSREALCSALADPCVAMTIGDEVRFTAARCKTLGIAEEPEQ